MFSKRKSFYRNPLWNKEFLIKFISDLKDAGFEKIIFKLPHNIVGIEQSEVPYQEFLDRERNYASVIIVATNDKLNETIKLLVVNISKKTYFMDDTFPSGHSEPTELYIQSPDPARVYSLFHFFYEYLNIYSNNKLLNFISNLLLSIQILMYITSKSFLIETYTSINTPLIDYIFIAGSIFNFYKYLSSPQGLIIKVRENKIARLIYKALKGELKDNPIVNIFFALITLILGAVLFKIFGL